MINHNWLLTFSIEIIQEILFKENQRSLSLSIAILIKFNNYTDSAIITEENKRLISISSI